MWAFLLSAYLYLIAFTSRIRVVSIAPSALQLLREGRPAVYTYWFQHGLFFLYYFGWRRFHILTTPESKRDFWTRAAANMGLVPHEALLEGGGRHALVTLMEQVRGGRPVVIPADGQRGPPGKCKAGCLIVAQDTQTPLIPVAWKSLLKIRIPRRSGPLLLPLPFSSIEVRLGAPIQVNRHFGLDELDSVRNQLTAQLDRLVE